MIYGTKRKFNSTKTILCTIRATYYAKITWISWKRKRSSVDNYTALCYCTTTRTHCVPFLFFILLFSRARSKTPMGLLLVDLKKWKYNGFIFCFYYNSSWIPIRYITGRRSILTIGTRSSFSEILASLLRSCSIPFRILLAFHEHTCIPC